MKKSRNLIYTMAFIAGVSLISFTAIASGYGNGITKNNAPAVDKDGSLFPGGACDSCETGDKDGSLFPGGPCEACTKDGSLFPGPCKKCVEHEQEKTYYSKSNIKNYVIPYTPVVYDAVKRDCCAFAPISLAYVDFRIKKGADESFSNKLGNYRFRIFGCRRFDKEATLNKGRILEKNIAFNQVFEDVVGDCYKVLPMPHDLCLEETPSELPEYVLTAEITDYFMNICDQYNWKEAQKDEARSGSSEVTITWRLMNLTKDRVFWKGETTGYGELVEGETNGEVKLIERAFADAVSNLRNHPGFEEQLATRFGPEEMQAVRTAMIEEERALNPAKCGYKEEYQCVTRCEIGRPGADVTKCQPCPVCPVCQPCAAAPVIISDGGVVATGSTCNKGTIVTDGGVTVNGCAPCNQPIEIIEDAGVSASGMSIAVLDTIMETGGVKGDGGTIQTVFEDGGVKGDGAVKTINITEDGGVKGDGAVLQTIFEDGGVKGDGGTVQTVFEDGGVSSHFDLINNCLDENGNVKEDGMCKVVDDTWIDTGDTKSLDTFCVNATDPCKSLSPENIYRLRSSIVQIKSPNGKKGAGLLISESFVLTSGDLVDKANNSYDVSTVRGDQLKARAVRLNPVKNTALMMLDKPTTYTPLALNLNLPEVGRSGFLTLGLLDVESFKEGEDYLENSAKIEGYRYTEAKGAEILANTFVQNVTVGGALIYKDCTINGMAPSGTKSDDGLDVFIPTETALRSLGISICGHEYVNESPWQQTVYKPVTEQIKQTPKAPEALAPKERK